MNSFDRTLAHENITTRLIELIANLSENNQLTILKELERYLSKEKRKHIRKPFVAIINYAIQNHSYQDFIKNISNGGLFIESKKTFLEREKVLMTYPSPHSQEYVKIVGEVVRTNPQGIGIQFQLAEQMGFQSNLNGLKKSKKKSLGMIKEVKKMAKVNKKKVCWNYNGYSSDVSGYKLYWAVNGEVGYDSDSTEVGNVTEVILPDSVSSFPLVAGEIEFGVTALGSNGNESDMIKYSTSIDFTTPDPPIDLIVESL